MSTIKNQETLRLLREAIKESRLTQAEISAKLQVSPPFLSRMLNGRDPLSFDRAYEILRTLKISSDSRDKIRELLSTEMESWDGQEKTDALKEQMLHRLERIGHNSFLSFILDFWLDLNEAEQMEVFRFFVDLIDKKQKQKQQ